MPSDLRMPLTVAGYQRTPPCAVGTPSALSASAILLTDSPARAPLRCVLERHSAAFSDDLQHGPEGFEQSSTSRPPCAEP